MTNGKADANGAKASAVSKVVAPEAAVAVDVSIPYNSAAMLAFNDWNGSGKFDDSTFQQFQAIYTEKVVAQVTAKKVARDFALETERLQAIVAKADADLAKLASGESEVSN